MQSKNLYVIYVIAGPNGSGKTTRRDFWFVI